MKIYHGLGTIRWLSEITWTGVGSESVGLPIGWIVNLQSMLSSFNTSLCPVHDIEEGAAQKDLEGGVLDNLHL